MDNLLMVAGDVVVGRAIQMRYIPSGALGLYAVSTGWGISLTRFGGGQPAVTADSSGGRTPQGQPYHVGHELTVVPSTAEYSTYSGQFYSQFAIASKDTYFEQLRKFKRAFSIERFEDRDGKPVALPLGVDEAGQSEGPSK